MVCATPQRVCDSSARVRRASLVTWLCALCVCVMCVRVCHVCACVRVCVCWVDGGGGVQLSHPNIVKIITYFEEGMNTYLVMELVTGGELFSRIVEKVGAWTCWLTLPVGLASPFPHPTHHSACVSAMDPCRYCVVIPGEPDRPSPLATPLPPCTDKVL